MRCLNPIDDDNYTLPLEDFYKIAKQIEAYENFYNEIDSILAYPENNKTDLKQIKQEYKECEKRLKEIGTVNIVY